MRKLGLILLLFLSVSNYAGSDEKSSIEQSFFKTDIIETSFAYGYFEGAVNISITLIKEEGKDEPTRISLSFNKYPNCIDKSVCPPNHQETLSLIIYRIDKLYSGNLSYLAYNSAKIGYNTIDGLPEEEYLIILNDRSKVKEAHEFIREAYINRGIFYRPFNYPKATISDKMTFSESQLLVVERNPEKVAPTD